MSGINSVSMILELRKLTGLDSIDLPDADAYLLLNRSYWQLQSILKMPQNEVDTTFLTIASISTYAIVQPIEAINTLAYEDPDSSDIVPIYPISEQTYDSTHQTDTASEGKPEFYIRYGTNIVFEPTPDIAYTIHVRRKALVTDLSSGNTTLLVDAVLHEVILYGAAEREYLNRRDFDAAEAMKSQWKDKLIMYTPQEVKEARDLKFAQVKTLRPKYTP